MTSDSPDLKHGSGHRNLNQRDEGHGGHDRRGRVHHDAQRTMIGIAAFLMAMRHLGYSQQCQQNQTDKGHGRKSTGLSASTTLRACLESCDQLLFRVVEPLPLRIHGIRCTSDVDVTGESVQPCVLSRKTPVFGFRLNYGAMAHLLYLRHLLGLGLAAFLLLPMCALAQEHKPIPLQPGVPGTGSNHRLILKDGSFQMVRDYQIVGDRVRYLSQDRGDWEEMPADLVDWEATRKWERDHAAPPPDDASPAMKEAEDLDKEEVALREDQKARMPEVAKGLELPDQDGVFVLDTYQGTPELVELVPSELSMNQKNKHGLSTLNPLAGQKASIELDGAHAKVHLHVNDPAVYLSLDPGGNPPPLTTHAFTVQTGGNKDAANRKRGAHSASSGFAIVRVDERRAVRIVGGIHVSPGGTVTQSEDVIPAKSEMVQGKHWLKLTPDKPLTIGEYALVEILSPSDINQSVWDFRVDPQLGDNPGSLGPIQK